MGDLLKVTEFKSRFAALYNMNPRDVTLDDFFSQAASQKEATVFLDAAAKVASEKKLEPLGITPERMVEVAKYRQDQTALAALEAKLITTRGGSGILGFSGRTLWLIAVSLMVCIVGIANAMLMSVTERFKEIATMKCLGATDGFIMINFILESAMQGFAGGVLGAVAGLVLGALRSGTNYGLIAITNLPAVTMCSTAVSAIFVGVVISILAAVYPAWVAARLAPMEAMRVE
jgi:cell division protein FtsX